MELQQKYLVIPVHDARELSDVDQVKLKVILDKINNIRQVSGKSEWSGVAIKDTWGIYPEVLQLLEKEVCSKK